MKWLYPLLTPVFWFAISSLVLAEPSSGKADEDKSHKLPPPLEKISLDKSEFERDGHFRVHKIRFGPAGFLGEDAVILTIQANRSVTYRHFEIYFRKFRDVRFYRRHDEYEDRFVHSTILVHSPIISADAANGEVFPEKATIEVWFHLDRGQMQKIVNSKANAVVFRPYKP